MLVSVNDVANKLKISTRAVQIRCKREGIVKIGNQYQITKEVAESWYKIAEDKPAELPKRIEDIKTISRPNRKNTSSFVSFTVIVLLLMLGGIAVLFYFNLDSQIKESKNIIQKTASEHKTQVKQLTKQLNDAHDVIHNQELEIQSLRFKDSIRTFKKW
jgi:hypothetical protein